MNNGLHIITGASRGLGLGIASYLAERGEQVVSVSRSPSPPRSGIKSIRADLSANFSAAELFANIQVEFPFDAFRQISLINNAGMVEPIAPAARLSEDQVRASLDLNLTAPLLLTSEFLKRTSGFGGRRVIFNVSSGVAAAPKASWSVYSAAKAGLEAFAIAIQKELAQEPNSRIVTFNPGVMDTGMQEKIRSASESDFAELKRFIEFKEKGQLRDPALVGKLAAQVVLGEIATDKSHVSIEELAIDH